MADSSLPPVLNKLLLVAFAVTTIAPSLAASSLAPVELDVAVEGHLDRALLVEAVLARNPGMAAATAAWHAAEQRPAQARGLEDPKVAYSFSPQSAVADGTRYGQVLRYSQKLPYPGTRRLRGERAQAESRVVEQDLETLRQSLATLASTLFDDYYVLARATEINEEHVALLGSFQRIATARYAAGEAAQQAPLQAEVEMTHLLHQRVVLETEEQVLMARINALLQRDPTAALPPPPSELADLPATEVLLQEMIDQALERRPELRAERHQLDARQVEIELAELAFKPDFEVMGSFNSMWSGAAHRTMIGVGVNLPIYRRRLRAATAEAESKASSQASRLQDLESQTRAEVVAAAAELAEAGHVVALYRDRVLPATGDQVAAALAGFRTGQSSFLSLIDAERSQRRARLEYERAIAAVSRQWAGLQRAVGRGPAALQGEEE